MRHLPLLKKNKKMIPFILATVGGFFVGSALKEKKLFSEGGSVEESNNIMLKNKAKEIKHHSEELSNSIKDDTRVDAWVVAKAQRSATDLSDITHYLDGQKMANGGMMAKGGDIPNPNAGKWRIVTIDKENPLTDKFYDTKEEAEKASEKIGQINASGMKIIQLKDKMKVYKSN